MQINFSDHESYHTVPLSTFSTTTAEQLLSEDRKKYLRSVAKVKSGQGAGPGVLSTASKNIYSRLVKQAVSWGFRPPTTERGSAQQCLTAVPGVPPPYDGNGGLRQASAGGSAPLRRCLTDALIFCALFPKKCRRSSKSGWRARSWTQRVTQPPCQTSSMMTSLLRVTLVARPLEQLVPAVRNGAHRRSPHHHQRSRRR